MISQSKSYDEGFELVKEKGTLSIHSGNIQPVCKVELQDWLGFVVAFIPVCSNGTMMHTALILAPIGTNL
ncbi:MAG: hypothetical protein IPJ26_15700 [Bacteroidetes bacterium]|nr:hypothetical protein [Bacteroidota bacterium]